MPKKVYINFGIAQARAKMPIKFNGAGAEPPFENERLELEI
jgi:hypothetical protein